MARLWAGIDMGKGHHHCVVIDAEGRKLLSQRVANDEAALLELIAEVTRMAEHDVVWAVDLVDGGAVLLTALLLDRRRWWSTCPGGRCTALRGCTAVKPRPTPAMPR